MTPQEKQNQKDGFLEYLRISYSITKIKTVEQYESTYKWIKLFDDRHGFADLTDTLKQEMLKVQL